MKRKVSGAWLLVALSLCGDVLALQGASPPTPSLPHPSGRHRTGTIILHLVDTSRPDPVSKEAGRFREIMVQVWYPAEVSRDGETAPYFPDKTVIEAMKKENYYLQDAAVLEGWKKVSTHSVLDAPVETGTARFPLLVLSPGAGVSRTNYTALAEELASHGAMVAVIDHPYEAITVLPDGRILSAASNPADESEGTTARLVREDARDASFVVDRLTDAREGMAAWLAPRIDAARIGILGHSVGGAVALETALEDRRFRACVDLDGGPFGRVQEEGVGRPALILRSQPDYSDEDLRKKGRTREQWMETGEEIESTWRGILSKNATVPAYMVSIRGTGHMSFSDAPFVMPDTITRFGGRIIEARRGFELLSVYLRAFFAQYLEGRPSVLLHGPADRYPEVSIRLFGKP